MSANEKKHVLITGGAGFIGLHLAQKLLEQGHQVDLIDNFSRGVKDAELEATSANKNVRLIEKDLLSANAFTDLKNDYEYIYHLAAIIGVANVLKAPYKVLKDNMQLLIKMLEFAQSQKNLKRFVFASTSEVYAGTLQNFSMEFPTPETTALAITDLKHPRTSYMLSKIYGEALCNQSGVPVTIVRPHNFYGPRMGLSHVVPELLSKSHKAQDKSEMEVFSPEHKRTFCYISDAVEMIIRLANSPDAVGEAFNIGNETPELQMREVASIVTKTTGKNLNFLERPPTPGSPERRCPSMKKTYEVTQYKPLISTEKGISLTYEWYKKNVFENEAFSVKSGW